MRAFAASGATIPEVSIDLTQTGREGRLFLNGLTSLSLISPIRESAYFVSPHPSVIVLARILSGLHRRFPVESASVTILEPASERGAAGIDELQEQTVRLLNFQPAGSKLFKGQIAFNILPETETANGTENLIRSQLAAILGNSIPSPSLMMHQAPVFHSESFSMFVRFAKAAAPVTEEIRRCLAEASGGVVVNENPEDGPSPVSVVGSDKVHIGRIAQDPGDPSIYGFWMTADNLRIAASNALGIAESIMLSAATPR
jgi:aspartate-semialdehyde dehydrogenase